MSYTAWEYSCNKTVSINDPICDSVKILEHIHNYQKSQRSKNDSSGAMPSYILLIATVDLHESSLREKALDRSVNYERNRLQTSQRGNIPGNSERIESFQVYREYFDNITRCDPFFNEAVQICRHLI